MSEKKRQPRGWFAYESFESYGECGGHTVHEGEDASLPIPTGVFDASGNMICREREPIGFRLTRR